MPPFRGRTGPGQYTWGQGRQHPIERASGGVPVTGVEQVFAQRHHAVRARLRAPIDSHGHEFGGDV
jgi:hypothetical protein